MPRYKIKHLTIEDRIKLSSYLNSGLNYTKCAKELRVSVSTISREVSRHLTVVPTKTKIKCATKLNICNGCPRKEFCTAEKRYYNCNLADETANENKKKHNRKRWISEDELNEIDEILRDGFRRKLSLYQIYLTSTRIKQLISKSQLYTQVNDGVFSLDKDLLINCYRKKEKPVILPIDNKKSPEILLNRTFACFQQFHEENPNVDVFELDSVIEKRTDKKAILTMTSRLTGLQVGFLIDKGSSESVNKVIFSLYERIGLEQSKRIFKVFLSDNGSEFSSLHLVENYQNMKISSVYFTRPNAPKDKSICERTHRTLRQILIKGRSLDRITQEELNNYFSNLNSLVRKSKNYSTSYDLAIVVYGEEFLTKLGLRKILPNNLTFRK